MTWPLTCNPADWPGERRARANGEHGSIIIFTAILLTTLVTMVALALGVGKEASTKRYLQMVADLAAQDAVPALGVAQPQDPVDCEGRLSARRNDLGIDPTKRSSGNGTLTDCPLPSGMTEGSGDSITITAGDWNGTTFTPDNSANANAVEATASRTVSLDFTNLLQPETATAVATASGVTQIQAGSFTARVGLNTAGLGILNSLLGGATLDAVSYQGIAASSVNAADLATQLGFASPTALFNGSVTYHDLVLAEANVLSNNGNTGAASNLRALATSLNGTTTGNTTIQMGKLLTSTNGVGNGSAYSTDTNFNAFHLLTGGLDAALVNGSSAVAINGLNLGVPGIASAQVGLHVIQAPQSNGPGLACANSASAAGEPTYTAAGSASCAQAMTSQIEASVLLSLSNSTGVGSALSAANAALGLLGISVNLSLDLPVYLAVAPAHAWVTQVVCGVGTSGQAPVDAWAHTGVASVALGQDVSLASATSQQNLTGSGGVSGTTQAGPVTVTNATQISLAVHVPGISTTLQIGTTGEIDILGTIGHVNQNPQVSPPYSFTGPFISPPQAGQRGPDTIAAGNISTPPVPITPTGNAVNDATTALAAYLPSTASAVNTSLSASIGSSSLSFDSAVLTPALAPVVLAAEQELNSYVTGLASSLLNPLASVLQIGLGGADVVNIGLYPKTTPPAGVTCNNPQLVQ